MHAIRASARYSGAIHAIAELLEKLKIDSMFVGGVARSAWLSAEMDSGAVDVLALMTAPQRNQLAMMASHRGFRVEREEIEQAEELDLVPLNFDDIRVHVLLASNALYGRMVAAAQPSAIGDRAVKIPRAEDLALMLLMADDQEAMQHLTSLPEFDLAAFRERLTSIGLGGEVAGA
ncbi:MAG TPA: hypothetical protein VEK79_23600 [Thermoanaerobaculia bacterium]|nr:hypothetical protein [Thermoanaerobaculia bacterium]